MLEPEEVEIGFFQIELVPHRIELVGQLVMLFRNGKDIVPGNGFDHAIRLGHKLLEQLSVIAEETIGAEARACVQHVKV